MALGWGALNFPWFHGFLTTPILPPVTRKKKVGATLQIHGEIYLQSWKVYFCWSCFEVWTFPTPKTKALMTTYMEHMKIPFGRLTFFGWSTLIYRQVKLLCKFTYYWQYTLWSHWWQGCQVTKVLHGRLREKDHFLSSGNTRAQLNRTWDTSREWKW